MRIKQPVSNTTKTIALIGAIIAYLVCYEVAATSMHTSALPSYSDLWNGLKTVLTPQGRLGNIWLLDDVKTTYGRLAFSMMIGCSVGVVVGILMGCFEIVETILYPILGLLSYSPATALVAVLVVLLDVSEWLYVALLMMAVAAPLACRISANIRNDVKIESINKGYTIGGSWDEVISGVVIRQTLPRIIDNIRMQFGPALVAVLAAEMLLAGGSGFGFRLRLQSRTGHWDIVYIYILVLATTGFLIEYGLVNLRKWWCPWFDLRK
jgi:ABC-type nitrate/sulfonate/bicarbonate transport system permease component